MEPSASRRMFLGTLGSAFLTVVGAVGCGGERGASSTGSVPSNRGVTGSDPAGDGGSRAATSSVAVVRPLIRPRGADAVWLATPVDRRPVAYLSVAERQVFVDGTYRDRASWLLDAHISVSTGLWRIPLLGDAPRVPIPPGDEAREFEEMDIAAWNPGAVPAEGDVRILVGSRRRVVIDAGCHPIQETDDWLSVPRMELDRCEVGVGEAVREDFGRLGNADRYSDRACTDGGRVVTVDGWAASG